MAVTHKLESLNATHDPARRSWVKSANLPRVAFPIQNLPFGVFLPKPHGLASTSSRPAIGVAIGELVLDLRACAEAGVLSSLAREVEEACGAETLNALMALGPDCRPPLRALLSDLLRVDHPGALRNEQEVGPHLRSIGDVVMLQPAAIGDYTDFYASLFHATNVGRLFRPDNPLLPNYKYVPIGYHGRSSSILISGSPVKRPRGQVVAQPGVAPHFAPSRLLDYELEVALYAGPGNCLGEPISIDQAESHIFGICLVNDWSARDIQAWEYQPLGPFLAKNFATTISPWIVTMEALAPFRAPAFARPAGDPEPLPYLRSDRDQCQGGIDIILEVYLSSARMRQPGSETPPVRLSRGNFRDLYWTMAQLLTHHTSNGCNLQPGDLLASGTVSGGDDTSLGCLLELTRRGAAPFVLPTGEERKFLEDGDEITLRGYCERQGFVSIGLGDCSGTILSG